MAETLSPPSSAPTSASPHAPESLQGADQGSQSLDAAGLQRELREAEDRLQALSDLTQTYTYSLRWSAREGARIEWVSDALERLFGIPPGPVSPQNWMSIVPPEDHAHVAEWFAQMLQGQQTSCEHRLIDREGAVRWVNHLVRPRAEENGWIPLDGAAQDITERRRTQDELADSVARFRALAENATHVVAEIDASGRIMYLNRAVEEVLGYPPSVAGRFESLIRHNFVHPDDANVETLRRNFASPQPHTTRMRFRRADGVWRWLEFSGRSFRTAQGAWRRVSIGRDVTEELELAQERARHAQTLEEEVERRTAALQAANLELRTLQKRLISAERLGVAEELAGSVAHAINNPLAALLGTVEMELEASTGSNVALQRIRRLAQRIQSVISQTLALFREGTLRLAEEEPASIVEEVLSEVEDRAASQGVRVHYKLARDVPRFVVDRTLLAAALVSLVENSLEAMPEGGDLWLDVSAMPQIGVVRFALADTGPGIPDELHKKVFEPFFTTKPTGTGLGLAIAQGVIRGHDGRISIDSHSSGGALIRVDVPFVRPDERPRTARGRSTRVSDAPRRRLAHREEHGPGGSSPQA